MVATRDIRFSLLDNERDETDLLKNTRMSKSNDADHTDIEVVHLFEQLLDEVVILFTPTFTILLKKYREKIRDSYRLPHIKERKKLCHAKMLT
jgi:hypothetical protein